MSETSFTTSASFDSQEGCLRTEASALGATPLVATVATFIAGYTMHRPTADRPPAAETTKEYADNEPEGDNEPR